MNRRGFFAALVLPALAPSLTEFSFEYHLDRVAFFLREEPLRGKPRKVEKAR